MENTNPTNGTIGSPDDFGDSPEGLQKYWDEEIQAAIKETEKWHKKADKIINIYLDKRTDGELNDNKFNLFHANTNILISALYSRIPHPEVNRRFPDYEDQVSRVAALILERALKYELSTDNYFDQVAKNVVFDRLVPGAGVAWNRYDAEINELSVSNNDFDNPEATHIEEVIEDEQTPIDYVHWKDFLFSPARTWSEVRWVARRVYFNEDQVEGRFGEDSLSKIAAATSSPSNAINSIEPQNTVLKEYEIWEIWDKTSMKVYWLCRNASSILDKQEDFLGLQGFFPCPKPLLAATSTSNLIPVPDYVIVQDQYQELNKINGRISKLTDALKVVGLYDASSDGVKRMLSEGTDNEMIPVKNWAGFSEKGGVSGQVDWLPLDQVIETLSQLQNIREKVKAQIYELTGISDIVRGASNPFETATAQTLKSTYATIRLQTLQHEVADFISALIHRKATLMCRFYEPQRLLERCGQLNQIDMQFVAPALQLLKDDFHSLFRINVTVDSLAMPNWELEKQTKTQFLSAVGGYLEKAVQVTQAAPQIADLVLELLRYGITGFKAGREVEGVINQKITELRQQQLQQRQQAATQPPKPSPEEMKFQQENAKFQQDMQIAQAKMQLEIQKLTSENERARNENYIRMQELSQSMEKDRRNYELAQQKYAVEVHRTEANLAIERQQAATEQFKAHHEIATNIAEAANRYSQGDI